MNLHQYAETHEVTNQPPPLDGANLYRLDIPLQEWSRRFGAGWAESRIDAYGALAGGPLMAAGFLANQNKPVFVSHDRYFLDNVCTKIWEVSFQTMTTYKGNFSAYLPQKEAADALRQKQHDADVALYRAKEGGRNQVVVEEPVSREDMQGLDSSARGFF